VAMVALSVRERYRSHIRTGDATEPLRG